MSKFSFESFWGQRQLEVGEQLHDRLRVDPRRLEQHVDLGDELVVAGIVVAELTSLRDEGPTEREFANAYAQVDERYGFVDKMVGWEIAGNAQEAASKTMIVLGLVPMAIIFFAVEALIA